MSLLPHLPHLSPSLLGLHGRGGGPAGPLQALHQFRYLGTPPILVFTGNLLWAKHCGRCDLSLGHLFFPSGEFTRPRLHSPYGGCCCCPASRTPAPSHGFGHIRPAPHTRDRSGSQGPAKCPQADGVATRWEPCKGRERQEARPWEQAPGWDDRADPWAPLALMPGQTGPLRGSFCLVGPERRAWELQVSGQRPSPQSHGCPQPLFVGQESARSWGRGHSPVERDCTQQDKDTLFPLLAPEVVAGGLILFMAQDANPSLLPCSQ